MKKITNLLIFLFVSPLTYASINDLKVATVKEMYSQSKLDKRNSNTDGAISDEELLYMYGTLGLKKAIKTYSNWEDNGSLAYIECSDSPMFSLFQDEPRDDFNKWQLASISVTKDGEVQANIKAFSMLNKEVVNYQHTFAFQCSYKKCLISDIDNTLDFVHQCDKNIKLGNINSR